MKIRYMLLAAALLACMVLTGCGSSDGWIGGTDSKYRGEYVYTSLDYNYKEYLYVEKDGDFGIGYYTLAGDGYYYRTAALYGYVSNNGNYSSAYKTYDDGNYVTGIYGVFTLKYSDELWVNMTEKNPYTGRKVTSDTQYYREDWRSSAKSGDGILPERIQADKSGRTCEKKEE